VVQLTTNNSHTELRILNEGLAADASELILAELGLACSIECFCIICIISIECEWYKKPGDPSPSYTTSCLPDTIRW
jgi:hypothetical protein